jgi:hypothetical protein
MRRNGKVCLPFAAEDSLRPLLAAAAAIRAYFEMLVRFSVLV